MLLAVLLPMISLVYVTNWTHSACAYENTHKAVRLGIPEPSGDLTISTRLDMNVLSDLLFLVTHH